MRLQSDLVDLAFADFGQPILRDGRTANHESERPLNPIDSDQHSDHNRLGIQHASIGEYDRAIVEFNRAIQLDAKDSRAYNNRGYAYVVTSQ